MFSKPKTKPDFPERKKRAQRSKTKRYQLNWIIAGLSLMAFCLSMIMFSGRGSQAAASAQSTNDLSESALQQIQALVDEKQSRTPAQQKMDSQLIYALRQNRGMAVANGVQSLRTRVVIDAKSRTVVDISTRDAHLAQKIAAKKLQDMGAEVINAVGGNIRANVAIESLETIAAFPEVRFVMPPQDYKTLKARNPGIVGIASAGVPQLPFMRPSFAERAARVRAQLLAAMPGVQKQITPPKGALPAQPNVINTSEGDTTHKANVGRSSFGANGSGVKIGVLSDGVSNLAAAQATGDLGPVTVLPGQTGAGDEGTAMLELVHDLAPGAQLYFATAFTSLTSFAQNIRDLRTAGCDIIIDDVIYFVETPFQDGAPGTTNTNGGAVVQAVNDVTTAGAMYFSSAGNEGNLNDGTASVWEGDFVDGGASPVATITGGTVHNFGGGVLNNQMTTGGGRPLLFWSDPLGASGNDYDLFVINSAGTAVVDSSTNIQNGDDDPVEDPGNAFSGERLVVLKKTAAAGRFLHLTAFGAELNFATSGTTHGHSHALNAFSVAATPAGDAFCAGFTDGPFPGVYTTANKVECFSSDGPRRILYNANSTPITPGNVSSTGGLLRQKPDITAADGTAVTGVGGFPNPFYGTSAAAPHAGAIAALIKSAVPGITNAQVRTALITSALDIEAAGTDKDSGAGIIMGFEAMQAAGATPMAVIISAGATIVSESCTPANGALDPDEVVTLSLCVQNTGASNTTALMGTLQATGGVTNIQAPNPQDYGVVVAGGPPVCRNFTFTVSGTCGGTVTASLQLQDGATNLGTVTYTFTLGTDVVILTENFDGVVAPALPAGWAATQGTNVTGAAPWVTSTTTPDTAPNDVFSPGPNNVLDNRLNSPIINITTSQARLSFRNNFTFNDTGGGFDGGVLEISINGGAFTDIIAAGGSFVQNGYNDTISVNFASPIAGRNAWSGTAGGYLTTIANLPASAAGGTVQLRWRAATDNSVVSTGWRIDTIRVTDGFVCASCVNPCVLTCPANITVSNDPNQCGAVVTYPAPTSTGDCGTITCNPPSGSFFPVGTTTVTCQSQTDGGGNAPSGQVTPTCTFTITVNDTQPPTITCPQNLTAVTATVTDPCVVVNFTTTASDNCPGVVVVCNPPSGSCFPVGVTTVTCTATDASGNTATCMFTVSVFNGRLQDDSEGCNNTVLFNTLTGDYRWCCHGTIFTGRGKVTKLGSTYRIEHNPVDRRVLINLSAGSFPPSGNASLQSPPGTVQCVIQDRDTRNDTCVCGAPAQ